MSKSPFRRFLWPVTQLPVTRCQVCRRTGPALPPGHPETLDLASAN